MALRPVICINTYIIRFTWLPIVSFNAEPLYTIYGFVANITDIKAGEESTEAVFDMVCHAKCN